MNERSLTPKILNEVLFPEFAIPYLLSPFGLAGASGHTQIGKLATDYAQPQGITCSSVNCGVYVKLYPITVPSLLLYSNVYSSY
jgi:hypothetical protein